ncbi:helix-turn-helix domain-containing protein [Rhizobium sp. PP-CC-3G-465]|uniref:helix-turn-helix domain-containing protein n=1 Tax=Rhizobium sp. PP-CC-3G-465 TaxID=2135648 RepID=UPI0010D7D26D|nr:helix-turn-helix protein [Rhizobium sp. PP-CC-3G-465]
MLQVDVARDASVTVRSLRSAESPAGLAGFTNQKLRDFYERKGIEFLGTMEIDSGRTFETGARWREPGSSVRKPEDVVDFHAATCEFAFTAARSFLGLSQRFLAEEIGVKPKTIGMIEEGTSADPGAVTRMLEFYNDRGIIFTGWRDTSTNCYFGVGVKNSR